VVLTIIPKLFDSGKLQIRLTLLGPARTASAEIPVLDRQTHNWSVLEPTELFPDSIPNWQAKPQNLGFAKPLNFGLQLKILDSRDGPKVRLTAWVPDRRRREAAVVNLLALHKWKADQLLSPAFPRVRINGKEFAVEAVESEFGGSVLYDVEELRLGWELFSPRFAIFQSVGGRRIADRIPIEDSGYEFVWSDQEQKWGAEKTPEHAQPGDPFAQVFERCKPGVVQVIARGTTNTGFIAGPLGYVLTSGQFLERNEDDEVTLKNSRVTIKFPDGSMREGSAARSLKLYDLALIRLAVPMPRLNSIQCAAEDVAMGQRCIVLRNPVGDRSWSFDEVRVVGLNRVRADSRGKNIRYLQLDTPNTQGGPGEPILDQNGRLVGVTFAERVKAPGGDRWIYDSLSAVPLDVLRGFVRN
jgi:hypothetical protein